MGNPRAEVGIQYRRADHHHPPPAPRSTEHTPSAPPRTPQTAEDLTRPPNPRTQHPTTREDPAVWSLRRDTDCAAHTGGLTMVGPDGILMHRPNIGAVRTDRSARASSRTSGHPGSASLTASTERSLIRNGWVGACPHRVLGTERRSRPWEGNPNTGGRGHPDRLPFERQLHPSPQQQRGFGALA